VDENSSSTGGSSSGNSNMRGLKTGGFSGTGADSDVTDFVHANEFVVNAKGVRNPDVRRIIDVVDMAQKNGTISMLNFSDIFGAASGGGKKAGGYSGREQSSPSTQLVETIPSEFVSVLRGLQGELSSLRKKGVTVSKYGRHSLSEAIDDIQNFNDTVR